MARKPKKIVIGQKTASELFTDREDPQKAFWDKFYGLKKDLGNTDIIHFYGEGGIGKSSLLKKLMDDLVEENQFNNVIMFSFEATQDKSDFLASMARQISLREKKADFPIFYHAYKKYLTQKGFTEKEIESKIVNSKSGIYASESLKVALNIGSDFMPGGGNTLSKVGELLIDHISEKIRQSKIEGNKEDKAAFNKIDRSNQDELLESLHEYFALDCEKFMDEVDDIFVFMLDGYEFMNDTFRYGDLAFKNDLWLSGTENRTGLVDALPNVLWVIAGREKIIWNDEILPPDNCHLLGTLSQDDVKKYFIQAEDPEGDKMSPELMEALYELTNGMPVFMDMCFEEFETGAASSPEDFGKDTRDIAARYLSHMTDEQQVAMKFLCGLTHMWTDEMVRSVVAKVDSDEPYDIAVRTQIKKIKDHTFVDKIGENYKLHDILRQVVRDIMESAELKKIMDATFDHLLGIINDPKMSRGEQIDTMQLLESNVEEYFSVSEGSSVSCEEMLDKITDAMGRIAGFYEDAQIWGPAIGYREKICNYRERFGKGQTGWEVKFAGAQMRVAEDYCGRYSKFSQSEDGEKSIEYYRKAIDNYLLVCKPDDWRVLIAKLAILDPLFCFGENDEYTELVNECFETAKGKPDTEVNRVFRYVYNLWTCCGDEEMFEYLMKRISSVDRTNPVISIIIKTLKERLAEDELYDDPGYWEYMSSLGEQFEADQARQQEEEEKDLADYKIFKAEYDVVKEYSDAQIKELFILANHLEFYYAFPEAYYVYEKLYEIIKRRSGGVDTAETIKALIGLIDVDTNDYVPDYDSAARNLRKAYQILNSDEELKSKCHYGNVLKRLADTEEMLEKPIEAYRYYRELKEFQNAGGNEVMPPEELDVKLESLSGLK